MKLVRCYSIGMGLETGISLHRGPRWGTWIGVRLLRTLRDSKRGSVNRASRVWELCEECLEGGLLYWELSRKWSLSPL